jgi:AcrR family transcriptional regulator
MVTRDIGLLQVSNYQEYASRYDGLVRRLTREQSKQRTRQRLLTEAQRQFRERGYGATTLEQIAEAAGVTKGAIYGHFSNKEDLLLSAIEASPMLDYRPEVGDAQRPLRERLHDLGERLAARDLTLEPEQLAVTIEFIAAMLRNPDALTRYQAEVERRLADHVAGLPDTSLPDSAKAEIWATVYALGLGLQISARILPDVITPEVFARSFEILADRAITNDTRTGLHEQLAASATETTNASVD